MNVITNTVIVNVIYGIAGLLLVYWLYFLLKLHRTASGIPNLNAESTACCADNCPTVSVIVAARNEQETIASCVKSIVTQQYPSIELIVVNDRSSDQTLAILQSLQKEYSERIKIISIESVPDGWGGQNNALAHGVAKSTGEWLCFTDADCRFTSAKTLAVAAEMAQTNRLDLLSILPDLCFRSFWEKIYLPLCSLVLLTELRLDEVNNRQSEPAYANGAFMLMRRSVYTSLGGHASVRGQVNDDVGLARLAKQRGNNIHVASNDGLVATAMYGNFASAWTGWIRNFSGTLQRPRRLLWAGLTNTGLFVLPWLGFIFVTLHYDYSVHWPLIMFWGGIVLLTHFALWEVYRHYPIAARWSVAYFPGALFVCAVLTVCAFQIWRRRAFVWQGVKYAR